MPHEMLVALEVADEQQYQCYRDSMGPLLIAHGGEFGYDFKVSDVLKSETPDAINRVFTIRFENEQSMDAFFSNPQYLDIKQQYFTSSVTSTTIIASYQRDASQ